MKRFLSWLRNPFTYASRRAAMLERKRQTRRRRLGWAWARHIGHRRWKHQQTIGRAQRRVGMDMRPL